MGHAIKIFTEVGAFDGRMWIEMFTEVGAWNRMWIEIFTEVGESRLGLGHFRVRV